MENKPIKFRPYLKSVIWGGDKICKYKGIPQPAPNIGESWEISAVEGHESVVAEGAYKGCTVSELADKFGADLLGKEVLARYNGKFPLLIKLIDAHDNLSVQVHPDDKLAMERHHSLGKSEMWYVISAEKEAKIYSGLNRTITKEEYLKHVENGTFGTLLAAHTSKPGDVFFLPAGRVHSIGAGTFLAEIQESSDITYRIYDYGRRDAQGNTRELHTEQAKDAIDYTYYESYKSEPADDRVADAVIAECEHFTVNRVRLDGEMELKFGGESFAVLMCLEGDVELSYDDGEMRIKAGDTVLVPAIMNTVNLRGKGTLLVARS